MNFIVVTQILIVAAKIQIAAFIIDCSNEPNIDKYYNLHV